MHGPPDTVINAYLSEARQRGDLQVAVSSRALPPLEDTRQERRGNGEVVIDGRHGNRRGRHTRY